MIAVRSITGTPSACSRLRLARQQLVVAGDQVCVALRDRPLHLDELAATEVAVGIGTLATLDDFARDGNAGRAKQLLQLGEIRLDRRGCDAQGALARARIADSLTVPRLGVAAIATPVHPGQV